jgi:type IV pilus assembly protein PilC
MIFQYKVVDQRGVPTVGTIDAVSMDVAIASLQKRGFTISSIKPDKKNIFSKDFVIFEHVSNKDLVILSRQLATLFTSQVSALKIFRMLGNESENKTLGKHLIEVSDDLQAGNSISKAIAKHPKIFTNFYINIVRSGEESGKIEQSFTFLADYLDRTYEVNAKARNALIYPAFISIVFVSVITLLMTQVIPQLGQIIKESGQEIPIYTRVVIGASDFVVNYGIFMAIFAIIVIGSVIWASRTVGGRLALSQLKISLPYIGNLFNKLYLSRISDNMNTMLSSAIPVVRALEVTADVVDNAVYENILRDALTSVKGGKLMSEALGEHKEIPGIMIQMIRVGEETGELGAILKTLAKFYSREVVNAVDTLVGLIEPAMIIALAVGVGFLLTAVIVPIYNVASGIQ